MTNEPTALQRAQQAAAKAESLRGVGKFDGMRSAQMYAAVAQAEALTRIAEVLETYLDEGIALPRILTDRPAVYRPHSEDDLP